MGIFVHILSSRTGSMIRSKLKLLSWRRMIFSLFFSVIHCFVFYLQHDDVHYLVFVADVPLVTALIYFLTGKLLIFLHHSDNLYRTSAEENTSAKNYFLYVSGILFLAWLPVFLAYYPGLFTYDVHYQIPQAQETYLNWQPLTHTLLLEFFYYIIGGKLFHHYTVGIAAATIFQMVLFAMMLSFIHLYLYKCGLKRRIRYIVIGLTAFLPQFSMLAISMTKDTLFSGFCGVFLTALLFERKFPEDSHRRLLTVLYVVSGIGIILFRSNGIFPIGGILLFSVYELFSRKNKSFFFRTVAVVVTAVVIQNMLTVILSAEKNPKNEMLSVPYQQIAGVYYDNYDSLTDEEKAYIQHLFPTLERYKPKLSDGIKNFAKAEENMKEFISFYFRTGLQYPYTYIKSFCLLNAGYLSVTDITYSEIYGNSMRQGVLLSDNKEGFDVVHHSYLSFLEDAYELLYTANQYLNIIGLNVLLSPAFYFWIILFLYLSAIMLKKKNAVPLVIFSGVLIFTLLFGPCVLVRYALSYTVCIPLLFTLVFDNSHGVA